MDIKDLRSQEELDFEHLLAHTKLMSSKAANYTFAAVEILEQLTQDIYISIDLFKHGDWDTFILQDALKLLQYTLDNLFGGGDAHSGQAKGLGVAYKYCDSAQPAEKDKKKAATEFCRARKEAIQAYSSLISHLREGGSLPEDFTKVTSDDMISTATFSELLYRNAAQKITQTDYESTMIEFCKSGYLFNKPMSSNITLILVFDIANIHSQFVTSREKIQKKCRGASVDQSWHPATIAIIRDKATGLVFTGATKAQASDIRELREVGYQTTVKRLGKKFQAEINKCSQGFHSSIKYDDNGGDRPPHWFKNLTTSSRFATTLQDLHKIPIFQASTNTDAGSSTEVVSLSVSTRRKVLSAPCTRCQCLYRNWNLNLRPPSEKDRWTQFKEEIKVRQDKEATAGQQFQPVASGNFNYCAETVAAAQLFSLYTGNISGCAE